MAVTSDTIAQLRPSEQLCLLIADISGYTGYLTSTELEHAQDVLSDFIGHVIRALEPAFELIETEGDAVFVVAPVDAINGQLALDIVDACYFVFRRHSRNVVAATTCACNACRQIPSLDLKFVIHTGAVVRARVGRRDNVTGEPVIVAHRLLKNSVVPKLGENAYLLLTADAVRDLALDESALDCARLTETYEHIGDVPVVVIDMERRWQRAEAAQSIAVTESEAAIRVEHVLPAEPAVVWDHVFDRRKRMIWQPELTAVDETSTNGRRDVGSVIHCAHGDGLSFDEEILEWRPFERFTWVVRGPRYGNMRNTIELRSVDGATQLVDLTEGPHDDGQREVWPQMRDFIETATREAYGRLADMLAARPATEP